MTLLKRYGESAVPAQPFQVVAADAGHGDNACLVEHWGYIFKGKVRVEYADGQEEILSAGDAFYIPGGHRPYMLEETELLQLTRKADHNDLVRKFIEARLFPSD